MKVNQRIILFLLIFIPITIGCQARQQTVSESEKPITVETNKDAVNQHNESNSGEENEENKEENQQTEKKEDQNKPEENTKSDDDNTTEEENQFWNSEKKSKLADFIKTWQVSMGQTYTEYSEDKKLDWYGVTFPEAIGKDDIQFLVDEQAVKVQWTQDPKEANVYNVVAIYADIESGQSNQPYLYLFTIFNDKPVVLVTAQNQGNNAELLNLYFSPTENQSLQQGFSNIVTET